MLHGNLKHEFSSLMHVLDDFSIKTGLDAPLSHANLHPRLSINFKYKKEHTLFTKPEDQ